LSARSCSGTRASASSRAALFARYSSPHLPHAQEEPFELQPSVAVLVQRLERVGASRRLSQEPDRRALGRDPLRELAELVRVDRASRLEDEQIARPLLRDRDHLARRLPLAVGFRQIQG
jgi:hypothetical protein